MRNHGPGCSLQAQSNFDTFFLVLLCCLCASLTVDGASLCYSFTVGRSESGQWSSEVIGQLNRKTILLYTNNKCHVFGVWRNRPNLRNICETQVEPLRDAINLIRELLYIGQETNTIRKPLILQANICCQRRKDGYFHESWDIGINKSNMLHGVSSKGTEVNSGASWIKRLLEKNRHVIHLFNKMSRGDCRTWLDEIKVHGEENLEHTALPPTTADVDQPLSMAFMTNPSVLLIILTCFLLHVF
ncbi:UL16-binding protein 1 [Psammomys obesus]|uniref:UL16-binding protein 1 n=1 Tax=Psammomys obesus TaxID=48139 RepID=UPI00245287E8|nr:UL16-binding protein 1 [Psammomys obesus]